MKAWRLNPPAVTLLDGTRITGRQAKNLLEYTQRGLKAAPTGLLYALLTHAGVPLQ